MNGAAVKQCELVVQTQGRELIDIGRLVQNEISKAGLESGLCLVFVKHTSASLLLTENCDPDVCVDLQRFMAKHVQDGDETFTHTAEGADDMSAHIRSVLTGSSHTVPIVSGVLDLGTWQGIYLWEHRYRAHRRKVSITMIGV